MFNGKIQPSAANLFSVTSFMWAPSTRRHNPNPPLTLETPLPITAKLSNRRRPPAREVRAQMADAAALEFEVVRSADLGAATVGQEFTPATALNMRTQLKRGNLKATVPD